MSSAYRRVSLWLGLVLISALIIPAVSSGSQKRTITEMDLFKFVWIADPQISPDGSRVAFVRLWVNQKADRYDSALWIVPTNGGAARQLTSGPRDTYPRWSPDGKRLAFIRSIEKDGRPQPTQIYLLSLDGGEAQALSDLPRGAGAPEWSPDGKTIAFASSEDTSKPPASKDKVMTEGGEIKDKQPERTSDVRVITRATYRFNGPGYLNPKVHSHIWTIAASATPGAPGEAPKPTQITRGNFDESNFSWAPDGKRIYFTANRTTEPYYEPPRADIYSIAADGSDEKKVVSFDGQMRGYSFSADGKRIAFSGSMTRKPIQSYSQPDLFVAENAAGATARNLTADYDFDIGGGIGGDQRAPRGGAPGDVIWSKDGRHLYVNVAEHGRSNLKRIDAATGKVDPDTTGDHAVHSYTATPAPSK